MCSGQIGLSAGALVDDAVGEQIRQALANVRALLESQGASMTDVVKTTAFLVDLGDFAALNQAYVEAFGDHRPARSAVGVSALPLGARVEIEAWAHLAP